MYHDLFATVSIFTEIEMSYFYVFGNSDSLPFLLIIVNLIRGIKRVIFIMFL